MIEDEPTGAVPSTTIGRSRVEVEVHVPSNNQTLDAATLATDVRRRVLDLSYQAHVGHIGSCLSVADALAAVYAAPWFDFHRAHGRDRFVMAKGHAGLALYAVLEAVGVISPDSLDTFGRDGSSFGVHPEHHLPGIDFSTGSLGQGLGMAVGAALAARVQRSERSTVALLSDAECNSGATWEAASFAGHHRLARLVAVVDVNGQQALGPTREICDQEPFAERWRCAGWEAREVSGHDVAALTAALEPSTAGPVVVVARTLFGSGVSFMEGQLEWHYLPMTPEQYDAARADVDAARAVDAR
ncbi:MAG: transketolase [Actinobacteria bacterium]|nr:transketolase [Actinomycetota bacterium]